MKKFIMETLSLKKTIFFLLENLENIKLVHYKVKQKVINML